MRLPPQPDGTAVHAPHLPQPVALADLVEMLDDGRFVLRGRSADLLEIAGKRASLGDLTRKLLAMPGVLDGVVFQLDPTEDAGIRRIAALVVAPGRGRGGHPARTARRDRPRVPAPAAALHRSIATQRNRQAAARRPLAALLASP